jgi:hypothetical protein
MKLEDQWIPEMSTFGFFWSLMMVFEESHSLIYGFTLPKDGQGLILKFIDVTCQTCGCSKQMLFCRNNGRASW